MAEEDPRLSEAARLVAEGDFDAAVDLLLGAWSSDTGNLDLAVSYACLLARVGRQSEAEELFAMLAGESPSDNRVWNNWGYLLLEKGDVAGAIVRLEQALAIAPDDFEALVNLGIALDRNGRSDAALDCYRRAVAINPESPVAFNNLGTALWRLGRGEEALKAFRSALALNPRDASAANNMGIIKMAGGDLAEASAYFRQALEMDPDSLAAKRNIEAVGDRIRELETRAPGKEKKCEKPPSLF